MGVVGSGWGCVGGEASSREVDRGKQATRGFERHHIPCLVPAKETNAKKEGHPSFLSQEEEPVPGGQVGALGLVYEHTADGDVGLWNQPDLGLSPSSIT